jgi:hypothetical protein
VTLSVTRKDGYVLAALVLALGLAAAFFVTWFAKGLERLIGGLRLADLLDRNARAQANTIDDLDTWVNGKLKSGDSATTVLSALAKLPPNGARAVREGRQALATALAASGIPSGAAYRDTAQEEAGRPDVNVDDLLDDGKAKPVRAQQLLEGLNQLDADTKLLSDLEADVNAHLVEACRKKPLEKIVAAQTVLTTIDTPERIAELTQPLTEAKVAYAVATRRPDCLAVRAAVSRAAHETAVGAYLRASGIDFGVEELIGQFTDATEEKVETIFERVRALPQPVHLRGKQLRRETRLGKALTALAIVAVGVFTVLTVWQAAYASKPDFAGFADYFALFSAALASGAAASVLGILAYWRPQPDAA